MSIRNAHSRARAAGTAALLLLPFAAAAQTTNIIRPIAAGQTDLMSVPLVAVGGVFLLVLVGVGLILYGIFCFAKARTVVRRAD